MKRNILMTLSLLLGLTANAQETLTLQQVKERALAHNINIRTADNAILQAREQKKEAQTLYFPQVSAVGMGFKSTTELIKGDIKVADLLPSSLAAAIPSSIASMLPSNISYGMIDKGVIAGVTAIQPIFAGGQIVNGNKLAKVGVEVSELQKRVSANTVELTAEQYYWQIISLNIAVW
jgi:putative outer membrane efflux protein